MKAFASTPERRSGPASAPLRWLVVALYVGLIFWTIPYVRIWSEALLRAGWGRWWLGGAGIAFAGAAVFFAVVATRRLEGTIRRRAAVPLACALAYGALVWYLSAVPDEVVHVAEYGVLGVLLWWALGASLAGGGPWAAAALAGSVGLVDELVQGVTPGRYFDWRDVGSNFVAGALSVWLVTITMGRRAEGGAK